MDFLKAAGREVFGPWVVQREERSRGPFGGEPTAALRYVADPHEGVTQQRRAPVTFGGAPGRRRDHKEVDRSGGYLYFTKRSWSSFCILL